MVSPSIPPLPLLVFTCFHASLSFLSLSIWPYKECHLNFSGSFIKLFSSFPTHLVRLYLSIVTIAIVWNLVKSHKVKPLHIQSSFGFLTYSATTSLSDYSIRLMNFALRLYHKTLCEYGVLTGLSLYPYWHANYHHVNTPIFSSNSLKKIST